MAGALKRADGLERRGSRRHGEAECRWVKSVRLTPGRDVALLNLSSNGAQIEATSRLLPGTCVELQLVTKDRRWLRSAQVLRCHVSALLPEGGVRYRAALRFSEALDLPRGGAGGAPPAPANDEGGATGYCVPMAGRRTKSFTGNDYPGRQHVVRGRRRKWPVSSDAAGLAAWHRD
jgi:hypothetical protein